MLRISALLFKITMSGANRQVLTVNIDSSRWGGESQRWLGTLECRSCDSLWEQRPPGEGTTTEYE